MSDFFEVSDFEIHRAMGVEFTIKFHPELCSDDYVIGNEMDCPLCLKCTDTDKHAEIEFMDLLEILSCISCLTQFELVNKADGIVDNYQWRIKELGTKEKTK